MCNIKIILTARVTNVIKRKTQNTWFLSHIENQIQGGLYDYN